MTEISNTPPNGNPDPNAVALTPIPSTGILQNPPAPEPEPTVTSGEAQGQELDTNGNGIVDFEELGPEAQAAINRIRNGINPNDPNSSTEISADGSLIELVNIDGVLSTQVDPSGNLWAFIYPGTTLEDIEQAPELLLETPPVVFLAVNAPIPQLGGSKPVFTFNLNAGDGTPQEILSSFEGGLGNSTPEFGGTAFFNLRAGGISEDGATLRGTGGVFWGADAQPGLKLASSLGTANGMWHVLNAINSGVLDALPEGLRDDITSQFGDLEGGQEAFISTYTTTAFATAGKQGIGFAYTGTVGGARPRLNSGELSSQVTLAIPNGNTVVRFDVDVGQYEQAASDNPFLVEPDNPNDVAYLDGWLTNRLALVDPLGETALPGARSFASFLYDHYTGRGLDQDEALTRIEIDLSGGPGSYENRIFQLISDSPPDTLSRQAFADAGYGQLASFPAMATAERLILNGATPQEAWTEVARIYADGFADASEFGINGGGFSGGYAALQGNLETLGIDPNAIFSEPDLTGSDTIAPPPLSDTVTGDLVASEVTGDIRDDVIDFVVGRNTGTAEGRDRIGEIVEEQEIVLADGTEAIYVRTETGNVFVVLDRSTFAQRNIANLELDAAVFALRGSSVAEIQNMVLEQNEGELTDRLVSLVNPDVPTQTVEVPRFTQLEVAVAGQRDASQFGGEGLEPTFDEVVLADGSTGTLITYRNAEGEIVEGYLQVFVDGQEWFFDRTSAAPTPDRSLLINDGEGGPIMVQLDDIDSPDGTGSIGDLFVDGSLRRQDLPNGGTAIYGNTEDGQRNVLYIAPGGAIRLLDVTNVAEDTVIDLLLREGSDVLPEDVIVPRGEDAVEYEPFNDGAFLIPESNTLVVASNGGVQLIDAPEGVENQLPQTSQLTGPALRFQQDMQALLYNADGTPIGLYTPEQAADIAYSNFQILSLDGDSELFTNNAYRDSRFETRGLNAPEISQEAYNTVFDLEFDRLARMIVPAQTGNDTFKALLEDIGITFLPDGRIDESTGSAVAQISRAAGDLALDPAVNAAINALPPGATETDIGNAVQAALAPTDNAEFLADLGALRGQTTQQIANLEQLGGNDAAIAFLRSFDLALGAMETAGGDFTGTAIGDFLSSSSGSIGYFLNQIGAGDAAAWSAFTADLGGFVTSLTDAQRGTLREEAYGLSLAGSFLILSGSSPTDPNNTAIISGELLTIVGDGLLASAGEIPPGFQNVTTPEFAIGSGFGRLIGRYADQTDTVVDDIGAILLEDGLPAYSAFQTGTVLNDAGEEVFNGELAGAAILASAGGAILNELIDGDIGRILQAVGDGAAAGIQLAAGAINPAQAVIAGVDALFDAIGIEVPQEVQLGALVALAAINASNPVGWVALAVQVVFQFASMRDFTVVTDIAEGIDADGDGQFDDIGQLSTDYSTNFWGRTNVEDGRLQYEVNSPNDLRLQSATFDLSDTPEVSLSVRNDSDEGLQASLTVDGVRYSGSIETSRGRDVNYEGFVRSGRERNNVSNAVFVSNSGDIEVPVRISGHGDDDRYGAVFELAPDAASALPASYSVQISGRYDPINPGVDDEGFSQRVMLTAEEYAELQGELGTTDAITLEGTNPLLGGPNNPDTPENMIQRAMDRIEVTFEGEDRDPNLYQYLDMNGDGNLDLVRYGIAADGDGLHTGDERYEVTLLGPNLTPLGLPTIKMADINEAANVASLAPYLMQWSAMRPETFHHGHDPVSIMNLAAEAGDLDAITELRDLDMALARDMVRMSQALNGDEGISDAEWAEIQGAVETNEGSAARRQELVEELELFDPAAYGEANPGLVETFNGNGMQLTYHYMSNGNAEGRAINTDGMVLETGTAPVWTRNQSLGNELRAGERMLKDEMLVSDNGEFAARFDVDGDLRIYDLRGEEPVAVWQADNGRENTDDGWVAMQEDGNLVIYDDDSDAGFSSQTNSETGPAHGNFVLRMQDNGQLVIYDQVQGDVLWYADAGAANNDGEGIVVRRATGDLTGTGGTPTDSANAARQDIMFNESAALTYLASDTTLLEAYQATDGDPVLFARQHFEATGQFGEVQMDFDPENYISAPGNDDLYIAFSDDLDGAINHYVTAGYGEKAAGIRPQLRLDANDVPNQTAQLYDTIMTTDAGALNYLASSTTLTRAFQAEGGDPVAWARNQFMLGGYAADISLSFDPENYISAPGNDDLAAAFWNDPAGATRHFVTTGLLENDNGTRPDVSLDEGEMPNAASALLAEVMDSDQGALTYVASSPDLVKDAAANGVTDFVDYARAHVLSSGWAEGRTLDFDPAAYLADNSDIGAAYGDNETEALLHYLTTGHTEAGRIVGDQIVDDTGMLVDGSGYEPLVGPEEELPQVAQSAEGARDAIMTTSEGAMAYLASDPELVRAFNADGGNAVIWAREHFKAEGQYGEVSLDFDAEAYISAPGNDDLVVAFWDDPAGAMIHYVTSGVAENDEGSRPQLNLDGNDIPNQASVIYSDVMTTDAGALAYIASSTDLIADVLATGVTGVEARVAYARAHLESSGWAEDRPLTFDSDAYLEVHTDLVEAFGDDILLAADHYISNGHAEVGRIVGDLVVTEDGLNQLEDA